ncbi:kinase-like domain-containing protein [Dichomitus squalens]|uniref:Kinase-like domain-containing protein n=2 Tax=Dichomitus squalens TaxID=114155 RepID=A0A4Q9MK65_9APHY|nr:kinase-like domain-containing protein [Dichomitus squalens]
MSTDFGRGTSIYMSPECIGDMTAKQPYDTYLSDIWSLGVVLVNMITGSQPWSKATIQDACFRQFLMDPDFLYKALPFSKEAHAIIQSMFHLDPTKRISLRALRAAILSLDTFFRPMSQRGYVVREHEHPTSGLAASGRGLESTTEASEIDIPCAASEPGVRVARDCSAGSAVDVSMAQLGFSVSSSCSSSRASSGVSSPEKVITPEGTTTATISISKAINEWERMMVDACEKEVRGDHGWQNGSVARMLMTQYRYHERCSF